MLFKSIFSRFCRTSLSECYTSLNISSACVIYKRFVPLTYTRNPFIARSFTMASHNKAPYAPQDLEEVDSVVNAFEKHRGKRGKGEFTVKKTSFTLPNGYVVDSWKLMDWDYKKPNLPTYARGLFTYKNSQGRNEIAVRGYDKFFNQEEVSETRWNNVEKNTSGPYELSVKENGCIIFMSGLDDGSLLVCSKHSTGPRSDVPLSHAVAGEKWIDKHLSKVGKTRQDLAKELRKMNATAIAELCDDTFEEHVLAYNPETAGMYLHGINLNLPEFVTYPAKLVDEFATEWGFKKTMHIQEDNIGRVRSFLEECAETGSYAGRETEGFVIRCQARDGPDSPWHDWFFKYKFDEPYLMYRQWRECTRQILSGKPPRMRKHKKITEAYLLFARQRFAQDPKLAKDFNKNHGIISLRNAFLKEKGLKGSDIIKQENAEGNVDDDTPITRNVVLVPVATLGCGKTTVAYALASLLGWGHVQNDNIEGRQRRPQRFAVEICNSLMAHPAVIADRNNHQTRERDQIITDVKRVVQDATFVALHYVHDRTNLNSIQKVTRNRVLTRGDNHQTIQAGSKSPDEIKGVMDGFLSRFQPVNQDKSPDDAFDTVIDLDITASSRENLERVVSQMHAEYPKLFPEMPSCEDLDKAIEQALTEYKPDFKQDLSRREKPGKNLKNKDVRTKQHQNGINASAKAPKIEFFGVHLDSSRINSTLEALFRDKDPLTSRFYIQLKQTRRLQADFHVTLIHRAHNATRPKQWHRLLDLYEKVSTTQENNGDVKKSEGSLGKCKVRLEKVVWDDRIMCFVVGLEKAEGEQNADYPSQNGEQGEGFQTVNPVAHITIGTASREIKPKESNNLLQRWLQNGSSGSTRISELSFTDGIILDGTVKATMQR